MELLDLPEIILPHILSFLTFDEVARYRIVCKEFNKVGWKLLNKGFHDAEKCQSNALKLVKAQLPRRESERKKHPLSRKCDILVAIETRLSMLSMAFSRYVESKLCCFIPGKVIDEIFHVMWSLNHCREIQPPHIFLQELRDVSTMAIEHFDEKIAPNLRRREMICTPPNRIMGVIESNCRQNFFSSPRSNQGPIHDVIPEYFNRISNLAKKKNQMAIEEDRKAYLKVIRQQNRKIKELETVINDQSIRLGNTETVITDLKRQFNELKSYLVGNFRRLGNKSRREKFSYRQRFDVQDISEPLPKKRRT